MDSPSALKGRHYAALFTLRDLGDQIYITAGTLRGPWVDIKAPKAIDVPTVIDLIRLGYVVPRESDIMLLRLHLDLTEKGRSAELPQDYMNTPGLGELAALHDNTGYGTSASLATLDDYGIARPIASYLSVYFEGELCKQLGPWWTNSVARDNNLPLDSEE